MSKKTLIVNLFAGPGAGKSTFCADIFANLKWEGIDCEMALEYVKGKVWEGSHSILDDQIYVFGKQQHELVKLNGKVDVVITDCPIPLSFIYYKGDNPFFENQVFLEFVSYNNLNIFLKRVKKYNANGRVHSEEEAKEIDKKILDLFKKWGMIWYEFEGKKKNVAEIVELIKGAIKK